MKIFGIDPGITQYDSNEEKYFSWYLDELYEAGYIREYQVQPGSFILSEPILYEYEKKLKTKTKHCVKKLMQGHIYTADFRISWSEKARGIFFDSICGQTNLKIPFIVKYIPISIIEIKPAFDRNNMTRLFTVNQKWVYQKYGTYVQRVTVDKKNGKGLFPETFTPAKYLLTDKTRKPRKLKYEPRTLAEYVTN